ncbi:sushi, von Willebrand factor type A, EGF and pentraxin domain-containing protein 1-like [Pecten maximus]|uniref:sushi, von Willebrand factor type A, EGF and pentraxin domain-containing protein 1-like n=1 Tax=Pecten maximus TaxID=6579 RepID=UPI0014588476|nr:sushi, von Willebrand factor type A, EGF and pentraxin domain-containing protein 1-like [Pecten maximus]
MFLLPVANDNLALSNFTVTPSNFDPSDPVLDNLTVVYTATDIAGNTAECRIAIVVSDESLPKIHCPDSFTAYLMDQPYTIIISSANFSVFPSSATLDFGPDQVQVSAETLDKDFTIYGNITDTKGNFDTCWFQVKIKATCNPATLTIPTNGQLNCSVTLDNAGYRCEGECNQGYYFYEDYSPAYDVFITECDIGGNWTYPYIPSCVSSLPTSFKQVHELVYQPLSNGSALSVDCLNLYLTSIQQAYPTVSDRVTDVCGFLGEVSTVTITGGQFTDIVNNTFTGTFTLEFDPSTVDASHDCVQATAWIFTKTTSVIEEMKNILGITDCVNITADYLALVTNEQMCDNNVKTRDQSGTRVCLVCPPGTLKNEDNSCELCPLGTFNDREGMTSCSGCPLGTWTEKAGASNSSDCKDVCRNGLYSNTRLPPCGQCPENSYPVSSHACLACPTGTKYIGTAAYLTRNCLQEPCRYTMTPNMIDSVDGPTYSGTLDQCEQFCEELEGMTTVRCTGFSYHSLLQQCTLHHGDVVSLKANTTFDHYSRTCNRLSDSGEYGVCYNRGGLGDNT